MSAIIIKVGFLISALLISTIHNEETENKVYDMDWFEIVNSPQEEGIKAEKTLKELCSNYDLVLFGKSIDCSKISIKTKQSSWDDFHYEPLLHVLSKRETNDLDLEEGSGNAEDDLAKDNAYLRSSSIQKEESQDNVIEEIPDLEPESILKDSEISETNSEKSAEPIKQENVENATNKKSDVIVDDELTKKDSDEPEKLEEFPQKNAESSTVIKKSDDVQPEELVKTEEFKKETKIQEDQINKPDKIEGRESANVDKLKGITLSLNNSFAVASMNINLNNKTSKSDPDPIENSSVKKHIETTTLKSILIMKNEIISSSTAQDTDKSSKLKEAEKIDELQSDNAELMNKNPPLHHLSSIEGSDVEKTLNRLASRAQINDISSNSNDAQGKNDTEKVTRKGDATILIVLFVIVVVIGGAAFTHHIIQKKRKSHQRKSAENLNNGVDKNGDIEQGTEMKPLIKTNDDPIDKK